MPAPATVKTAAEPWQTVSPEGCVVIVAAVLTVSTAPLLVAVPHAFVTTTEYVAASPVTVETIE